METQEVARNCVRRYQGSACHQLHHRDNREVFKAGALQEGLTTALVNLSPFFGRGLLFRRWIFCGRPYLIRRSQLAMDRRRSTSTRNYSALTEVEAILLDGISSSNIPRASVPACFSISTARPASGRRAAIEDAGGLAARHAQPKTPIFSIARSCAAGNFVYLPEIECPSELPVEMERFKIAGQARWPKGWNARRPKNPAARDARHVPGSVKPEAFSISPANITTR